jgi:putative ABC transport system substrate-binding protein
MRRRELIAGLLLAATTGRAQAQQSAKVYHIAIVHPSAPVAELTETGTARFVALFKELRRLGYVEGQNILVERYSGAGRTQHYSELASEVVRKKPDLIFTNTSRMVQNFKAATATIPIVGLMADPVPMGIVDSLARPGGNITGVCVDAGLEIQGKRLELLREAVPGISRVGFLASRDVWENPLGIAALRPAAERMGVSIIGPPLEGTLEEAEYRRVFDAMIEGHPDAVIVSDQTENSSNARLIVELAAKSRLPTIYPYREQVEAGGLMAYATDLSDLYRRAAGYVDQILKGAKPGEIPIYLAVKFELIVNVKAAKAIGLTIPPSLLLRANEVIE